MMSVLSLLLLAGGLSACAATPPFGIPQLNEPQRTEDKLPEVVTKDGSVDPLTSRLLASEDGVSYFAATTASADDVCFVAYESDDAWTAACAEELPVQVGILDRPEARLGHGSGESDEWRPVTDYVAVRKG